MNVLKQVCAIIDQMIPNEIERKMMKCYILRKMLNQSPLEIGYYMDLSTPQVNDYAKKAFVLFDLHGETRTRHTIAHEACLKAVLRVQIKRGLDEVQRVNERMNRMIKQQLNA